MKEYRLPYRIFKIIIPFFNDWYQINLTNLYIQLAPCTLKTGKVRIKVYLKFLNISPSHFNVTRFYFNFHSWFIRFWMALCFVWAGVSLSISCTWGGGRREKWNLKKKGEKKEQKLSIKWVSFLRTFTLDYRHSFPQFQVVPFPSVTFRFRIYPQTFFWQRIFFLVKKTINNFHWSRAILVITHTINFVTTTIRSLLFVS